MSLPRDRFSDKSRKEEFRAYQSGHSSSTMQLKPWKPVEARLKSNGGRWLCDNCCQYQHGSKQDHKRLCGGFTLLRTRER